MTSVNRRKEMNVYELNSLEQVVVLHLIDLTSLKIEKLLFS